MAAAAIAAAAIPAVASIIGGRNANRARRKEAKKNRAFQERMRNTQWQAGLADMEQAGLNPALAYSQGGAASPSGSMASQDDVISPAVTSGQSGRRLKEEIKLLAAQTRDVKASATQKGAMTGLIGFQQGIAEKDIALRQQMFEMIGFDMIRARNMARAQAGSAGQKAATLGMLRQSIFGSGGAISPLRIGR